MSTSNIVCLVTLSLLMSSCSRRPALVPLPEASADPPAAGARAPVAAGRAPALPPPPAAASLREPQAPPRDCGTALFLTEIHMDPRRVPDRFGEFIELYNADLHPVRLDGWRLTDLASDSHVIAPAEPLIVPPDSFVVLGASRDPERNGGIAVDYAYTSFHLSNDVDRVRLEDPCGEPIADLAYPLERGWPRHKAGHSIEQAGDPRGGGSVRWARARKRLPGGDRATPGFAPWRRQRPPAAARATPPEPQAEVTPDPPGAPTGAQAPPDAVRPIDSTRRTRPTGDSGTG